MDVSRFTPRIARWIIVTGFRILLISQHLFSLHPDVVMMHLLRKGFMENYRCWYAHGEVFVRKNRMGERVVGSTSSAKNMQEAANDNTNPYRNMVMDAMRMNQGNASQCPIVEE